MLSSSCLARLIACGGGVDRGGGVVDILSSFPATNGYLELLDKKMATAIASTITTVCF